MLNKKKSGYVLAANGVAAFFAISMLTGCATNEISATPTENAKQELSTPALIAQALANGEITAEQRLLYLAYALFEHESLPARFRSSVGWRPTSEVKELIEAIDSPAILCSMSPGVRSEFQRLFEPDITCD